MTPTQLVALKEIAKDGSGVNSRLAEKLGISRQAVSGHLRRLKQQKLIYSKGRGPGVVYRLLPVMSKMHEFALKGLDEQRVWRETCAPVVASLPENVRDIWHYGVTEMVNNAIDHSCGSVVSVDVARNAVFTDVFVADDGEGIFQKIQRALDLYDPREAILELAKGKFTTDPDNHSGEGIFFSSKAFDAFDIRSGCLHFMHESGFLDFLLENPKNAAGTVVMMRIANDSKRTIKAVFDKYAVPDEYTFAKTVVPVRLAQHEGERLVSRSQAKRLTRRFEKFKTVILDFDGVEQIGQAFADEVFRVFQNAHPDTKLVPTSVTPDVKAMISRAKAARAEG